MGEYYRIFYMFENFIRKFAMDIMSDAYGEDWWDNHVPEKIRESAQFARDRELNAGVTPRSEETIVYIPRGGRGAPPQVVDPRLVQTV
jgi:hypothetical protein